MSTNSVHPISLKEWEVAIEKVENDDIIFHGNGNETKVSLFFKNHASMTLTLFDVVAVSREKLRQYRATDVDNESCINGLRKINEKAIKKIETIPIKERGSFHSQLLFFNDDIEEVAHSMTIEDLSAQVSREPEMADMEKTDPNALVSHLVERKESDKELNLAKTILKDLSNLSQESLRKFRAYLFDTPLFTRLMQEDNPNKLFDYLSPYLDNEELNNDQRWMKQVLDFAFSSERYQALFLQDEEVSQEELNGVSARSNIKDLDTREFSNHPKYNAWIAKRMEGSTTLKERSRGGENARAMWRTGEKKRVDSAIAHRSNGQRFTLGTMRLFHKKIAKDEEGVEAGVLRSQNKKVARAGGDWTHVFCPPGYLDRQLEEFETWINREIEKCDQGKKNPILLAAQTYQRLVTLHPFENANGRVARMMMDYVLERYEIPPPLLGEDVLDARFNLAPINKNHTEFLSKVVSGVERSREAILDMH